MFVVLGGGEIIFTYHAPMALVMHFGLYGLAGYLVPALLVLLGLLILFDPQHRTFYSVLSVLASLGTWLTSNLGGFILGMLLGVIGGSLAFGWQTGPKPAGRRGRRYRPSATH
jgi:prepilin signal peptidase PulO-like enzyme (type II secretory pathway)